jgi:ketosteroid isomerase-like protein
MIQCSLAHACFWIVAGAVIAGAHDLQAQPANSHAADEAAIRQAGKDYATASEHGDSKALSDFWTADGTYTDDTGRTVKVREWLAKSGNPGGGGARSNTAGSKLHFVADDVAMEEGETDSPPTDGHPALKNHYVALWVRDGGRWKLDNVQEMRSEPASTEDEFASLNAFVGEWSGEANKITVHIAAKWDANKKFLHRQVTMTSGSDSLIGTQEIGWDPLAQQIRSWTVSDDGSFSEGVWSLEGNLWMALASRVLPDGRVSEATQVYKFPDKNTIVWKSIRCSIDGQPTDDFEVVLKRSAGK